MKRCASRDKPIRKVLTDFSKGSAVPVGASSAPDATAEVSETASGESSCHLVGKMLPGNAYHQRVPLADLLSVCTIYLGFYWVPLVHLSLLLVVCWHLLLLRHGPCPRGHPLMFRLHWPQRLSFRLKPSGAAFGLEIVNYSGKGLNPGRREEECLRGTRSNPGSLTHPGSPFFWIKTCSPL